MMRLQDVTWTVGKDVWNFFSIATYYCCIILEGKDMSCVKHGAVVMRL